MIKKFINWTLLLFAFNNHSSCGALVLKRFSTGNFSAKVVQGVKNNSKFLLGLTVAALLGVGIDESVRYLKSRKTNISETCDDSCPICFENMDTNCSAICMLCFCLLHIDCLKKIAANSKASDGNPNSKIVYKSFSCSKCKQKSKLPFKVFCNKCNKGNLEKFNKVSISVFASDSEYANAICPFCKCRGTFKNFNDVFPKSEKFESLCRVVSDRPLTELKLSIERLEKELDENRKKLQNLLKK